MSIPQTCYEFLDGITFAGEYEISPFVRNHDGGFPAIVFSFGGDAFPSATHESAGPRLVRWSAMVLARTMEEAETAGQLIIAEAQAAQQDCPHKVVGVQRDYEAAYDGQRSGIYIHVTELEFFA